MKNQLKHFNGNTFANLEEYSSSKFDELRKLGVKYFFLKTSKGVDFLDLKKEPFAHLFKHEQIPYFVSATMKKGQTHRLNSINEKTEKMLCIDGMTERQNIICAKEAQNIF